MNIIFKAPSAHQVFQIIDRDTEVDAPVASKSGCATCSVQAQCLPRGLSAQALTRIEALVTVRRKVSRGDTLIHSGEKFTSLYAIRTGFFKSRVTLEDGREQVMGFQMAGEHIGLDGIVNEQHSCDTVALEDAEVCVLPFDRLEALSRDVPLLQRHLYKIMSQEIVRERGVMLLLGHMRSDKRVASLLLDLTQRLHARGFSASALVLRMTREEIGSFLCLKLETVSRTFSKLVADGILEIKQRHVHILDMAALSAMVNPGGYRSARAISPGV